MGESWPVSRLVPMSWPGGASRAIAGLGRYAEHRGLGIGGLAASIIDAEMIVAHNVFQGVRQGFGTPLNLIHPVGWRTGFNWNRGFTVMEQFSSESHRRRQSQQG